MILHDFAAFYCLNFITIMLSYLNVEKFEFLGFAYWYQILLFSATFNDTVKEFVSRVVKDGNQLFVKKEELSLDSVKQYKVYCPDELAKIQVIKDKIFELGQKWGQCIIFVRTKNSATMLYNALENYGYDCTSIHGNIEQALRDKMVREFKDGLTKVLISTDLLARGFDQAQVLITFK